ncbi:MAG TPA: cobalamin-dependent protein [Candidatus Binatia bacterium]|nr:cobalamin-dependent protein [Candidatus Binatia bacterium]
MLRPVWLLSQDTSQFCAPPLTTGGLKATFLRYGRSAAATDVELVHFLGEGAALRWLDEDWWPKLAARARAALAAGVEPVLGLSCYTWNVAEFLEIARAVKHDVPELLVVAGGPHVQRAQDFLHGDGIDVVVLGEGEETFVELLDCEGRSAWRGIAGLAFVDERGAVHRTAARARARELDRFPSALDVVELRDASGKPRYRQVAYETSRGCPYRCSFCEWGTGAIGTKMFQLSLDRIQDDLERLVDGGIHDIWLCDSNFGALREDRAKAEIIVDLKKRTGRPNTFATSWSKNHNQRVQDIVRLLHRHGLLWHYHLALQTLTPLALELSHRTNMRANDYEPIARTLAAEGVPIAAELIWGLPGDNLPDFERNLDHLMTVFPNINIFGYTLLPGTEFFERREEYRLETLPVAGYGKAKGEYVVGCHTFDRDGGEEGYFLITAYVLLARGHVMPLAVRHLALSGRVGVSRILRACLRALVLEFGEEVEAEVERDLRGNRMAVYESRAPLFVRCIADPERTFSVIRRVVSSELVAQGAGDLVRGALAVLELDRAFCPRSGPAATVVEAFDFAGDRVADALGAMMPASAEDLARSAEVRVALEIRHPGLVGEVLLDPDGGSWMRGRTVAVHRAATAAPIADARDAGESLLAD